MLRRIRIPLAILTITAVTLLFLGISWQCSLWIGWVAKIQFLPALLALNVGVLVFLILLTLLFGRIYCSVICPLGVMQDGFSWLGKLSFEKGERELLFPPFLSLFKSFFSFVSKQPEKAFKKKFFLSILLLTD